LFFTAANLWNHINDAEDDLKAGRAESAFLLENRSYGVAVVVSFYLLAFLLAFFGTKDREVAVVAFFIASLFTWLYSDKIYLGRFFRRFKEDYRTEVLTYVFCTISFPLLVWTFFSELSLTGLAFSASMGVMYFSGFILKDLKDISADSEAGYNTLGVVFPPSLLLKLSVGLFLVSVCIITIASILGAFPKASILISTIFVVLGLLIYLFNKESWKITPKLVRPLKIYTNTYLIVLLLLGMVSFFNL